MAMQRSLSDLTGIPSLKIAYNNVFGYYIEVRNTHKDKVPEDWIRKQTLVNAERYVTQELKEYEEKILGAEEKILVIEGRLFNELVAAVTTAEFLASPMEYLSMLMQQRNEAKSTLDSLKVLLNEKTTVWTLTSQWAVTPSSSASCLQVKPMCLTASG